MSVKATRFVSRKRQACHSSRQSPWPHRADTSAAFRRALAEHPEREAAADASNPMGRIGDPEAAPVAVSLASEDCRHLTGNTLFVDGGAHINGVAWAPDLRESA
jgi:NAD(P)-dependent dehydrogenase (short-subunit alcohol dehydrogenase family)